MGRNITLDGQTLDGINTGSVTVGATVVSLSANDRPLKWGVQVVARSSNATSVWVGVRSNLTAGAADATDGFELPPGGTVPLAVSKESNVKLIAGGAGEEISFISQ